MRKTPHLLALAASAAMASLPSLAAAQPYGWDAYDQQQSYQQQQDTYRQRLQDYNQQRAAYDQAQRDREQRSSDRYDNRGYNQRIDRDRGYDSSCEGRANGQTAAGGVIGALAGAAIGSNLAGRGSHTTGAVLGAVAGGVIGANVARSTASCDASGYYYSYNQTRPYRESADYRGRASGRYDYSHYRRSGCRLVVAPARWNGSEDTRYVRVCPDSSGRYRLTD